MSAINDGGPAFPTPCNRFGEHSASMSLRDWFAGQALMGLIQDGWSAPDAAREAYRHADQMLAARQKDGQP